MKRPEAAPRCERLLVRDAPAMSVRLQWTHGFRSGSGLPSSANVEWAGRIGHPSSYGLLGGTRTTGAPQVAVWPDAAPFRHSLAGRGDHVRWGLPQEYEAPLLDALRRQPVPMRISTAAHGEVGSSLHVFQSLAALLGRVLAAGVPPEDEELWRWRDACWNDR